MIAIKKKFTVKTRGKEPVIVTVTKVSAKGTLFPEKLARVNSILPKVKWLADQ